MILVRHAHASSNESRLVSCLPPGQGLTSAGRREARALGELLAADELDLGVATELRRTRETLELALAERDVPTLVLPELNEIGFGSFEGGTLEAYRAWAWANEPDVECPGGGESRATAAARFARGLELLLARSEHVVLVVGHALPIRYVLDAADGSFPAQRLVPVDHAVPHRLEREAVEAAAETLRVWAERPRFADAPSEA
ncbi:MAG TPA: histidine phosphatase family protein [Gaiellaceae bacterium]|nr:histidine phosphatase family protein [Gaiellaceae bacterium]